MKLNELPEWQYIEIFESFDNHNILKIIPPGDILMNLYVNKLLCLCWVKHI